jgi:hypothetical protein
MRDEHTWADVPADDSRSIVDNKAWAAPIIPLQAAPLRQRGPAAIGGSA